MNPPYPPPGQPYPPGYLPPRRGMGCFAKGCLATVLVLVALGVVAGIGGWFIYSSIRPFVGLEPVAVRTYPATAAQYAEVAERIQAFQNSVADSRAATLTLSADDLNVCVARNPSYEDARGKFYFLLINEQLVIETSVPLDGRSHPTRGGRTFYFSGKLYCNVSYSGGDFDIMVTKIETLGGQAPSAFIAAMVSSPDFNRGLNRSFNEGFRGALHKNPAGEAFMAKVHGMVIGNNHLVIAAGP